jgi:hypothetical protein
MNQPMSKAFIPAVTVAGMLFFFLLASRFIRSREGLHVGEMIPAAALRSSGGAEADIELWRGSPTVLVLFQSACSACKEQIANLEVIAADFPGLRFALLSLNGALPGEKVPFNVYFDPEGRFIRRMRRLRVPTLYWIDAAGKVKYVRTGCRTAASDALLFRTLLGNSPASNFSQNLR